VIFSEAEIFQRRFISRLVEVQLMMIFDCSENEDEDRCLIDSRNRCFVDCFSFSNEFSID
jgi:hypothetical protein